jgi:deoxyinosine 3'endonuclease (endonuclease V)
MESFSVQKAHNTQLCLSQKIIVEDKLPLKIKAVAGVDVSYVGNIGVGALTVLDYDSLELLELKLQPAFRATFFCASSSVVSVIFYYL